jgi:2-polyprenyl-6-methoxyphenol hydroxylase-like FAD-dependent oxidoreductase
MLKALLLITATSLLTACSSQADRVEVALSTAVEVARWKPDAPCAVYAFLEAERASVFIQADGASDTLITLFNKADTRTMADFNSLRRVSFEGCVEVNPSLALAFLNPKPLVPLDSTKGSRHE